MADSTILLLAILNAFCSIFHMFIEAVRYFKSSYGIKEAGLMAEPFKFTQQARKLESFLGIARYQLIREADGRDDNDVIGPILTPEAITITIIERSVSSVDHSGTLDIIGLYEGCLEHLVRVRSVNSRSIELMEPHRLQR